MRRNRKRYFLAGFLLLITVLCVTDRYVWMKKRVLRHNLWEHDQKDKIRSSFIEMQDLISFKKDTMVFKHWKNYNDTIIFNWQYFSTISITDPKTGKTGHYTMKGANWSDYIITGRLYRK